MTKKLEQLTNEQAKEMEEKGLIEYKVSATLSGPGWVHNKEDYENTIVNATNKDIIDNSDYFEATSHENGMKVVPYEKAKGGAMKVHSLFVNYFSKKNHHDPIKQPETDTIGGRR